MSFDRRGGLVRRLGVVGAFTLATLIALPLEAQRRSAGTDSLRHIQSVIPMSGPPGTLVTVHTENLPLQAKVHVGVGSIGTGFEALAQGRQGEWGEVDAAVRIPGATPTDRPIYFIVFNAIFSPIGISEPFHVTDAQGRVRRTGVVVEESRGCLVLQGEDKQRYALTGASSSLPVGNAVSIEGYYSASARCGAPNAIAAARVVSN